MDDHFTKLLKEHHNKISEKQVSQVNSFVDEALIFNKKHNIFVRENKEEVFKKDVIDCLPLIKQIQEGGSVLDLGSGGGFPGILIGIFCPKTQNSLLEKNQKKCYFLNKMIDFLGLKNTNVIKTTINEKNNLGTYDLITARAFSSAENILNLTQKNLSANGKYLLLKGRKEKIVEELNSINTNKYKCEIIKTENEKYERHLVEIKINE